MDPQTSPTDAELSASVRAGDREAFGELWRRHSESATAVARQYGGIADPDDIVQEASRKVFDAIIRGGGPFGAFRPYMNQTVRNVAVSMSRQRTPDPIGDVHDLAERGVGAEGADYADGALERMITVRAFKALPQRWQTALWYTYVEGMASDEAADHLGLSRNAAAALIIRAREGLRREWLKAHVSDQALPVSCRWVVEQLPALERDGLTVRQRAKVEEHLEACARCSIIAAEINDLAARLPIVILPFVVAGFDVLGGNVADLLAYSAPLDPVAQAASAEAASAQGASVAEAASAPKWAGSSAKSLNLSKLGAMKAGRIWLVVAVVGGVTAAAIAANLAAGDPTPTASHDRVDAEVLAGPDEDAGSTRTAPPAAAIPETATSVDPDAEAAADEPVADVPAQDPLPARDPEASVTSAAPEPPILEPPAPEVQEEVEAPAPTPAPTLPPPTPDPVPEEPVVVTAPVVLAWPGAIIHWMNEFAFSGTGHAGWTVQLVLADGTPLARTTVLPDATWAVSLRSLTWTANTPMAVSARHLDSSGTASETVDVGSFTFVTPQVFSVDNGVGGGIPVVAVSGTDGMTVEAVTEGGSVLASQVVAGGVARLDLAGLDTGASRVLVRYVDPATGNRSASVATTVTVQ